MNLNALNICTTCIHRNMCVLTTQKSQVWCCSEYDEETNQLNVKPENEKKSSEPPLVMA